MPPIEPVPAAASPLRISIDRDGDRAVLTLVGEFDRASLEVARQAFGETVADGLAEVVVDMRGLAFIDSSGIAFLLNALQEDDRKRLRFVPSEATAVRRVLQIAGVDEALGG